MGRRTGLGEVYELFYRYASALHHVDPMGLGMLIDGDSLDVQPAPTMAHIGIALGMGNHILLDSFGSANEITDYRCNPATINLVKSTSADRRGRTRRNLAV